MSGAPLCSSHYHMCVCVCAVSCVSLLVVKLCGPCYSGLLAFAVAVLFCFACMVPFLLSLLVVPLSAVRFRWRSAPARSSWIPNAAAASTHLVATAGSRFVARVACAPASHRAPVAPVSPVTRARARHIALSLLGTCFSSLRRAPVACCVGTMRTAGCVAPVASALRPSRSTTLKIVWVGGSWAVWLGGLVAGRLDGWLGGWWWCLCSFMLGSRHSRRRSCSFFLALAAFVSSSPHPFSSTSPLRQQRFSGGPLAGVVAWQANAQLGEAWVRDWSVYEAVLSPGGFEWTRIKMLADMAGPAVPMRSASRRCAPEPGPGVEFGGREPI